VGEEEVLEPTGEDEAGHGQQQLDDAVDCKSRIPHD
jgi:hypothetical protein